jgi:hypothetical protein
LPRLPACAELATPSIAKAVAKTVIFTRAAIPNTPAAILKDEVLAIVWSPVLHVLPHHAVDDDWTLPERR